MKHTPHTSARRRALLGSIMALGLSSAGFGQTWSGNASPSTNWSAKANWQGALAPFSDENTKLNFAGMRGLQNTNDFPVNSSFKDISFDVGAGSFILGGNSFTLFGTIANNSSSPQTIGTAIRLGAGRVYITGSSPITITGSITNANEDRTIGFQNSAGTTLSGNIYLSDSPTSAHTLHLTAKQAATISGSIHDCSGGAQVPSNIKKWGKADLTLSGINTFTGYIDVRDGTLRIDGSLITGDFIGLNGNEIALVINGTHTQPSGGNPHYDVNTQGRYYINAGSTLAGNGRINLNDTTGKHSGIRVYGTVAPGDSEGDIGALTLGIGKLTIDATRSSRTALSFEKSRTIGCLAMDIGPANTSDNVAIIGRPGTPTVKFQGTVIDFNDLTSGALSPGDYLLFDGDQHTSYEGLTVDSRYAGTSVKGYVIIAGLQIGGGLDAYIAKKLILSGNDIYLHIDIPSVIR